MDMTTYHHEGIQFLKNTPYAQKRREVSRGAGNSTNDSYDRFTRGYDRRLDGRECTRTGERGPTTQEEKGTDIRSESGGLGETKKSQKADTGEIECGAIAPSLESFIWLVEFIEEHGISMEVWFHKLCYVFTDGKQKSRRALTLDEMRKMYED